MHSKFMCHLVLLCTIRVQKKPINHLECHGVCVKICGFSSYNWIFEKMHCIQHEKGVFFLLDINDFKTKSKIRRPVINEHGWILEQN